MRIGRLGLTLICLVLWIAIPVGLSLFQVQGPESLASKISSGVLAAPPICALLLLIYCRAMGWRDLGFNRPAPDFRLRLLWLPAVYILLFAGGALVVGLPSAPIIAVVFVNAAFVGLSEEWMFRGVLLQGLRSRMSIWPAILISSALFGAVHVLNVFGTGDLVAAILQAFGAGMVGLLITAIRIRAGSLYPAIILHALWDFSIAMMILAASGGTAAKAPAAAAPMEAIVVAALLFLPIPVYALYLLRGIGKRA